MALAVTALTVLALVGAGRAFPSLAGAAVWRWISGHPGDELRV